MNETTDGGGVSTHVMKLTQSSMALKIGREREAFRCPLTIDAHPSSAQKTTRACSCHD